MNNFKKNNRFGGGGFKDGFGAKKEMFKTTCADCGKTCEVPFKPNGKKPVYCNDCFAKNGGQTNEAPSRDFQKKSYAPSRDSRDSYNSRPSYNSNTSNSSSYAKPQNNAQNNDKTFEELTRQLVNLNSKFDKLVTLAEAYFSKPEVVVAEKTEKKSSKKGTKKSV